MTTPTRAPADASADTQVADSQPRSSPFQGLRPFDEKDAAYFFGRTAETDLVCSNLLASRLTLVYGPSGVGKTSLLRAGVLPTLTSRGGLGDLHDPPPFAVAAFDAWRDDDPVSAIATVIEDATAAFAPAPPGDDADLSAVLHRIADGGTTLLLVLDQFEEYFRYHGNGTDGFASELVSALTARDLDVHILIAIREDRLSQLDRFKGDIPFLFDNYLRIDHLTRDGASAAILEPVARYSQRTGTALSVEPGLVARVLDDVAVGQQALLRHGSGSAVSASAAASQRYEATFLQLVMTRIWEEERAASSMVLREQTFERVGGARVIVREHLDRSLDILDERERDIAAAVFDRLVTPSGTKVAQGSKDLWTWANRELKDARLYVRHDRLRSPFARRGAVDRPTISHDEVAATLHRLASNEFRILRSVADAGASAQGHIRYEIYHDVLGPPIVAWSAARIRRRSRIERSSRRAILFGGIALTCAMLLWLDPLFFFFDFDYETYSTVYFVVGAAVIIALVLWSWFFGATAVLAIRGWRRTLWKPVGGIALSALSVAMLIPLAPFQNDEPSVGVDNTAIRIVEPDLFPADGADERDFSVDLTAGQALTLNVTPKAEVDVAAEVLGPTETSLLARSSSEAPETPLIAAVEAADDGTHTVVVRRTAGTESAALHIGVTDGFVQAGTRVRGELAGDGVDTYTLVAAGPHVIEVNAEPDFDAIVAVFPATRDALAQNDDNPFGVLDSFIATDLPANAGSGGGVFHVAVSSFDGLGGGAYTLRVRPALRVRAGTNELIGLPPRSEAAVLLPDADASEVHIESLDGSDVRAMLALSEEDGYWAAIEEFDLTGGDSTSRSLAADEILLLWGAGDVQVSAAR